MARLLLNWLSDLKLKREVMSMDEDFRNGYLLGEILAKYNQQPDFESFIDKDTPDAKIHNFCLLEPTVRRIGVTFNSKIAFDIINAKPGTMRSLLYEFKVALDKISKHTIQPEVGDRDAEKPKILRVVQPSKPFYDKTMSTTFENSMRAMMENPNDVMMQKNLLQFKEKHADFRYTVNMGHSQSMDSAALDLQRRKEINRNRKQHEVEFAKAWETINVEQWKKNQRVAHDRRQLEKRMDSEATQRHVMKARAKQTNARDHTLSAIEAFDKRLETEIIPEDPDISKTVGMALKKTVVGEPGSGLPTLTYIDHSFLESGLVSAQKAMKEQTEDSIKRQQIHHRRRQKFFREREGVQTSFLKRTSETAIVQQLWNICQAEYNEDCEREIVFKHKIAMAENRLNRETFIEKINGDDARRSAAWQAQQAQREKIWVINSRMKSQSERAALLATATASANRQQSIDFVGEIIDRILDVTDWACSCRVLGSLKGTDEGNSESDVLPAYLWSDIKRAFASNLPVCKALPFPQPSNVSSELPHSLSQKPESVDLDWLMATPFVSELTLPTESEAFFNFETTLASILAADDTNCHIDVIADVEIPGGYDVPPAVASTESAEQTGIDANLRYNSPGWLTTAPSKHLLGEALVKIRCVADPLPEDPPAPVTLPPFPCRYVLCGTSDLARRSMATSLAETIPGLQVVRAEDLVATAVQIGTAAVEVVESERDAKQALSLQVFLTVAAGQVVSDDLYVSLITQALLEIPAEAPGFVIEDFPSTKQQALLFMQALSGINYENRKPQAIDKRSPLAPPLPAETIKYDISKCGLDVVLFLETGSVVEGVRERVAARTDMSTGKRVEISDSTESVVGLQEIFVPNRPLHTSSIELAIASTQLVPLKDLFGSIGVMRTVAIAEYESLDAAVAAVAAELKPPEPAVVFSEESLEGDELGDGLVLGAVEVTGDEFLSGDTTRPGTAEVNLAEQPTNTEVIAADGPAAADTEVIAADGPAAAADAALVEGADVLQLDASADSAILEAAEAAFESPPLVVESAPLPRLLAVALSKLWHAIEQQSNSTGKEFFNALRDIRYQSVQRRRAAKDVLEVMLVRRDSKQNLFEDFRSGFNAIEEDFRFDPDCQAELYLRALEFGDAFNALCDKRKQEADKFIADLESDAVVQVAVHRVRSEGAALLQAEFGRFVASLNILFDYTKAVAGFDRTKFLNNFLEETLSATIEAGGGADSAGGKGKPAKDAKPAKGKEAPGPVPFREPVAAVLLPSDAMAAIPGVKLEPVVELDAKGKPKAAAAKKGEEPPPSDPFDATERAVLDRVAAWTKESFVVNRAVYASEEGLCVVLETAIWHEAERLKVAVARVRDLVTAQQQWLREMETSLISSLRGLAQQRHATELSVGARLVRMIGEAVASSEPIREEWLVAPDVISVMKNRLVVPAPSPPPVPVVNEFFSDRMNEEQAANTQQWLNAISTGSVILEPDMLALLDQGFSAGGPLGSVSLADGSTLSHVTFPKTWRAMIDVAVKDNEGEDGSVASLGFFTWQSVEQLVRKALVTPKKLAGIDEHVGVVSTQQVAELLMAPDFLSSVI